MSKIADLLQAIKFRFLNIIGKKFLLLSEPEEITNETEELKDNPLKERIKYNPNLSYTDRLSKHLEEATFNQLSNEDLDKILVGAVLEEKGASEEFMKLFKNSELFSADPKYWESHLDSHFSTFVVPDSYYEKTLDGIQQRTVELRNSIDFIGSEMYTVSSDYHEQINSSLLGSSENTTTVNVCQNISLVPNRPEISNFTFTTSYNTVPNYFKDSPSRMQHLKSEQVNNTKSLIKINGVDDYVHETYSSLVPYDPDYPEQYSKKEYCYTIKRNGTTAKICINPESTSEVNTPLYVQLAPDNSLLDTNKGLGWFNQNSNIRRLLEKELTVEQLNEELKQQGLSVDTQYGIGITA